MTESELKSRLQQKYNHSIWKDILNSIFPKVEYLLHPAVLAEKTDTAKFVRQIGNLSIADGNIGIFEVEVADSIIISRNRVKLREIAAKYIDQGIINGAFVFYFHPDQNDYRFTFIYKKSIITEEKGFEKYQTNPKRFTYILGPNEACRTATIRLIELQKNESITFKVLQDAFSIEKVTKEFYSELKTILKLIKAEHISRLPESKEQDFSQLLINRLLFLKFLEKKGWLFVTPQDSEADRKNYLNRMKENFADRNLWSDFFYHLFFRGLNLHSYGNHQVQSSIHNIIGYVPFLNGGLFQEANELEEGWNDSQVSVDNEAFDLIFDKLLNRFNFTIDENLSDEIEVSLNPDLLGYTYEEFIADSHGQGAYYTHPVEVGLMCRESLKTFLEERTNFSPASISNLVDNYSADDLSDEDALHIYKILVKIKILDPAIGSGVYPVRMMQELVAIHQALAKKITSGSLGQIASNRLIDPNNRYYFKLNIVQNNIYGTDIDHYAVEIAKLRFWLSLVVDFQMEINSSEDLQNVPALPNLDFKLRAGDSLLSVVKRKTPSQTASKKNGKSGYNLDLMFRAHQIDAFFEEPIKRLSSMKSKFFQFEELKRNKEIPEHMTKQQMKENIQTLEKNLAKEIGIDEIETFKNVNHILWQIHFAEIFDEHLQFGFDICIANPPYLRQEKINELFSSFDSGITKDELVDTYEKLFADKKVKIDKKSDLYVYFFLRGINLLSEKGVLCYICSNSWLDVGYGKSLQEILLKTTRIKTIIDNSAKRSFEKADVNTTINIFVKDSSVDRAEGNQNTGRKESLSTDTIARFIVFKDDFEKVATPAELNFISSATTVTSNDKWRVYPLPQNDLYKNGVDEDLNYEGDKWGGKYLRAPDIFFTIYKKANKNNLITKLDKFFDGERYLNTGGADGFFIVTEFSKTADENFFVTNKNKLLNNSKVYEGIIEKDFLIPLVKDELKKERKISIQNHDAYCFVVNKKPTKNVLNYIHWGEVQGYDQRSVTKLQTPWYKPTNQMLHSAKLLVPRSFNETFIIHYNPHEYLSLRYYRLHLKIGDEKDFVTYFNSTLVAFLLETLGNKSLGQGALDFFMADFLSMNLPLVIDGNYKQIFDSLSKRKIGSIFEELRLEKDKSIRLQKPKPLPDRKALDDIIFDALGLTKSERTEVYYAVCELVQNRLNKAKSV